MSPLSYHHHIHKSARSQGPDKKEPEGFYSQIVRAVVQIEEYRSICTLGRDLPIEGNVPVGSAFFVRDRVSDNEGGEINRVFIVTARHVVEGRADLFARVKTRPDSDETMILRLPRQLWVFHPEKAPKGTFPVDVAAMWVPSAPMTFLHCTSDVNPSGCGMAESTKQPFKNQVGEPPAVMDKAIFFGFPEGDVAKGAVEPFVRAGVVAYAARNPEISITNLPMADDSVFLIDAVSFPGNSGGPVILEPQLFRADVRLLGLITGTHSVKRYAMATSVKRIHETLAYARSRAKPNSDAWSTELPRLEVKCRPAKAEQKP